MRVFLWLSSSAAMAALLAFLALRAMGELLDVKLRPALEAQAPTPDGPGRRTLAGWKWPAVFLAGLAVLWLGAFLAYQRVMGTTAGFLPYYWKRFTQTGDSAYYLFLAENGYVSAGERVNAIVFYPLYPLLVRIFGGVIGGRYMLAGVVISQVCYGFSSVILAKLAVRECAHPWAALAAYWLYPFGFFCQGVFTEGLFLLLSLSGLFLLLRRRWLAAGLAGFLCALTRVQGVLLLLPGIYCAWRVCRRDGWRWRYLAAGAPLLGFGIYLCINEAVCGSFFAFQYYESIEPWYQSVQWLGDTIVQQLDMAMQYPDLAKWIYWPQMALYYIGAALLLYGFWRKVDNAWLLYGGAYLGMCYTAGWLISGGRYMLGCLPMYLCVGRIKSPATRYGLLAAELCIFGLMYVYFMQGQAIM